MNDLTILVVTYGVGAWGLLGVIEWAWKSYLMVLQVQARRLQG